MHEVIYKAQGTVCYTCLYFVWCRWEIAIYVRRWKIKQSNLMKSRREYLIERIVLFWWLPYIIGGTFVQGLDHILALKLILIIQLLLSSTLTSKPHVCIVHKNKINSCKKKGNGHVWGKLMLLLSKEANMSPGRCWKVAASFLWQCGSCCLLFVP